MNIALQTPQPAFAGELADVLRLFFSPLSLTVNGPAQADEEPLRHEFTEEDGRIAACFTFRGQSTALSDTLPPDTGGAHRALVEKRMCKRLSKRALYALCKQITGYRPPWGSLTGIRPTRLLYEQLSEGKTPEEGCRELERLFDVSPDKAEVLRRIVAVQQSLPASQPDEADLYVSIPFCRTRCAYCSFPGEALGKGRAVEPYLDALRYEISQTAALVQAAGLKTRALYIGGGTPTALSEEQLKRLLDALNETFPAVREFTVEAGRPDTLTRGKLEAIKQAGAGRISINPQTMQDETLRRIGRDHTAEQTVRAFALAREVGHRNINMDLIAGLPGETEADMESTLRQVEALHPDSLTVHTLAIKRSSRLNLENAPLPDGRMVARMTELGAACADRLAMQPYYLYRQKHMAGQQQNVGYACNGLACLYNVDIMEETTSILAMGAGAISKRVFPDRQLRIVRAPNVSNVGEYTARVEEMMQRKRSLFIKE